MSKAQLVITAVVLEGRSKSEVARDYDVSRQWVQQLCKRYQADGEAAYIARSRRPHHSPHAVAVEIEERIVRLRKTLTKRGLDAGADTIAAHLAAPGITNAPAVSTIWRILKRRGFVTPQPHKRPRSSWKRFEAELPNQCWQADVTHWHLAHGGGVEILNIIDDHSRLAIASLARRTISGPDVTATFTTAFTTWGPPASVLTDNGAIFTGAPRRGGRTALEITLGTLGINYLTSRPYPGKARAYTYRSSTGNRLTIRVRYEIHCGGRKLGLHPGIACRVHLCPTRARRNYPSARFDITHTPLTVAIRSGRSCSER